MASKRKIGVARRDPSAVSPAPTPDGRQIGVAAKPSPCPVCPGSIRLGMWIHSARCGRTVILWYAHGFRMADWRNPVYQCCPYRCAGTNIGSGVTHAQDCAFFTALDREIVADMRVELQPQVDEQAELDSLWDL